MALSELIARITIWLALSLYAVAEIGRLRWRGDERSSEGRVARALATAGCLLYLIHVLAAFGVFHAWSHALAYDFTAEQTEQLVGLRWGAGLFANYLFTAVWISEVTSWWARPQGYRRRPRWRDLSVRSFFAFMIANAAVIFVVGAQRWMGVAIVCLLAYGFVRFRR